jgi:hypothetical protein
MESLTKKNETEIQDTVEGHSRRLKQAEDRISELEDRMEIKGKTEPNNSRPVKGTARTHQLHQKTKSEYHGH